MKTKIIIAFVLGTVLSVAGSAYGAILFGSKGVIEIPKETTIATVEAPTTVSAPQEVKIAQERPITVIKITAEEARLRSLEARISALEAKLK